MKITPSRAIRIECGVCNRDRGQCTSKHCALNHARKSLERIKNHCRNCSPDHRVEECTGQVIGTQAQALHDLYKIPLINGKAECVLYQYRYGHNPKLSHSITQKQLDALSQGRVSFQKAGQNAVSEVKFESRATKMIESPAGAGIGAN